MKEKPAQQKRIDAAAEWISAKEPAIADLSLFRHITIQRDALSEEWRARFIAETRDLYVF